LERSVFVPNGDKSPTIIRKFFMPKILVADPIGAEGVDLLKTHAEVDVKTGKTPGIAGDYLRL